MKLPEHILTLIQARLRSVAAVRVALGKPKFKTRGFRYDLEDFIHGVHPEKIDGYLIPASKAARARMPQQGKWKPTEIGVSYEHAVPLSVLFEILMAERENLDEINATLSNLFHISWVTKEEDKQLNAAGFNRKMPAGWTPTDSPFTRYEAVGIEFPELLRVML